jgi:hypothetical protein
MKEYGEVKEKIHSFFLTYMKEMAGQPHALAVLSISKTLLAPIEQKAGWSYS